MWSLTRPSAVTIDKFLAEQRRSDFTYTAVGDTARTPPAGYNVDRTRVSLGEGERTFELATAALGRWEQFQLGWVEPGSSAAPLESGTVVAVMARVFGGWWLNACRIGYVVRETGTLSRFGFAYGTLAGHAESGEERFLVEWDRAENCVWYDILAFSKPRHILARLGYPLARRTQKRFARDSAAAMRRAVKGGEIA